MFIGLHTKVLGLISSVVHYEVSKSGWGESTTSYTFPMQTGGIIYFPWHSHQIEGTDGF